MDQVEENCVINVVFVTVPVFITVVQMLFQPRESLHRCIIFV